MWKGAPGTVGVPFSLSRGPALSGCMATKSGLERTRLEGSASQSITVSSSAFSEGGMLPKRFAAADCGGTNTSPPLSFANVPPAAKTLVLISDDPDAPRGTWTHWTAWNLPPTTRSLSESGPLPAGTKQGVNDSGQTGYGGPCPPSGTHRYYFRVYAVDKEIGLSDGAPRISLERELKGHVLAWGETMGKYEARL